MSENTCDLFSLSAFPRAILHVDGDAFFASVEQALRPELRGKPVATGKERAIIDCASYEARSRGVRRTMRLSEAFALCPNLVHVVSDHETYGLISQRMLDILGHYTPDVEPFSIDEAFADLSGLRRIHRTDYAGIALEIKKTIQRELGISVSVGLSANRTLAKLASGQNKPDGFTVWPAHDLHELLRGIPLKRVCGFGHNTVVLLEKHGLKTALDYARQPEARARQLLGKVGGELWHELRGRWVYPLETTKQPPRASISRFRTFTPATADRSIVRAKLIENVETAFTKLRRHGLKARGFSFFLRDAEFQCAGVEAEVERSTSITLEAVQAADGLFEKMFQPNKRYRQTGVVLFHLESNGPTQYSLFDDIPRIEARERIDEAVDRMNRTFGRQTVRMASTLPASDPRYARKQSERTRNLLPGESSRKRLEIPIWQITV